MIESSDNSRGRAAQADCRTGSEYLPAELLACAATRSCVTRATTASIVLDLVDQHLEHHDRRQSGMVPLRLEGERGAGPTSTSPWARQPTTTSTAAPEEQNASIDINDAHPAATWMAAGALSTPPTMPMRAGVPFSASPHVATDGCDGLRWSCAFLVRQLRISTRICRRWPSINRSAPGASGEETTRAADEGEEEEGQGGRARWCNRGRHRQRFGGVFRVAHRNRKPHHVADIGIRRPARAASTAACGSKASRTSLRSSRKTSSTPLDKLPG